MYNMNISTKDAEGNYEGFIRWTSLAFTNTEAKCIINGKHSPGFKLPGGGRQGDNLFPLLFAIVVHGLKTRTDASTLRGITPQGSSTPTKIKQYADDTCFFISQINDIYDSLDIVETFCKASGMVINLDKTDLMYMGSWVNRPPILPQPLRINIVDPNSQLRYLGVMIGNSLPKDIAWTRVKSKIVDTIAKSQLNHPTLTERTLTTNSVVTGNMLYGVAHSHIHENTL